MGAIDCARSSNHDANDAPRTFLEQDNGTSGKAYKILVPTVMFPNPSKWVGAKCEWKSNLQTFYSDGI